MYTKNKPTDALTAQFEAQKIAFGPMVFHAAKAMIDLGVLAALEKYDETGADAEQIAASTGLSTYAVDVLLESGLSSNIVHFTEEQKYCLSKVGFFLLNDELTQVNMKFVSDVCYQGVAKLQTALKEQRPAGLDCFGNWNTIYDGLSSLPQPAKDSWFEFDHYYSDIAFNVLLPIVFERHPLTIMDIGANTGKWAIKCLEHSSDVHVVAVDLPGQLRVAKQKIEDADFLERVTFIPANMRTDTALGAGVDAIWMSQFLCCFSHEEIVQIFTTAKDALYDKGRIYVLETFWDTQRFEASAFSLHNTSLYFTSMANGNSKMYRSSEIKECAAIAGLRCEKQQDGIGIAHTLLCFSVVS